MSENKILLIVDDEPSIRNLLQEALQRRGYRTLAAGSGEEALIICKERAIRIGCLLTDCQMPGMSGVQLAERLLSLYPDLRVVLMSGSESGPNGYPFLLKPFSLDQVLAKLQEAMPEELPAKSMNGQSAALSSLTPREKEVLTLLAEGYSAVRVADELGIKCKTVACHRTRIYDKLELQGVVGLVRFAIRNGILQA